MNMMAYNVTRVSLETSVNHFELCVNHNNCVVVVFHCCCLCFAAQVHHSVKCVCGNVWCVVGGWLNWPHLAQLSV